MDENYYVYEISEDTVLGVCAYEYAKHREALLRKLLYIDTDDANIDELSIIDDEVIGVTFNDNNNTSLELESDTPLINDTYILKHGSDYFNYIWYENDIGKIYNQYQTYKKYFFKELTPKFLLDYNDIVLKYINEKLYVLTKAKPILSMSDKSREDDFETFKLVEGLFEGY